MLNCYGRNKDHVAAADGKLHDDCIWFDLGTPTDAEIGEVEQAIGLKLPDSEHIGGVELSQRAAVDGDALRLAVPYYTQDDDAPSTAVALVLTPQHFVSLHYAQAQVFAFGEEDLCRLAASKNSVDAFANLIEVIVGHVADRLENIAADVGTLSAHLFEEHSLRTKALRSVLAKVGRAESRLTRARLTATGMLRIVMFAHDSDLAWIDKMQRARLRTAQKDLEVLCELDSQLTDKLQFLLDAALGYINIEQNDVMKVFTVASVAAIPPVILAGIWGMNFSHMPELHWHYSYPVALAVILASILVPVLWFKRRGWF